MQTPKPIKRHPGLVAFSKDHHFGLLLVWKIRDDLKKSVELSNINNSVIHFFDTDLIHHFTEEEELLFPKLPKDQLLRIQAETDHKNIRQVIEDLRQNPENKDLLNRFADALEQHIRFEERELFNFIQENLPEATLTEMVSSLKTRHHKPSFP